MLDHSSAQLQKDTRKITVEKKNNKNELFL